MVQQVFNSNITSRLKDQGYLDLSFQAHKYIPLSCVLLSQNSRIPHRSMLDFFSGKWLRLATDSTLLQPRLILSFSTLSYHPQWRDARPTSLQIAGAGKGIQQGVYDMATELHSTRFRLISIDSPISREKQQHLQQTYPSNEAKESDRTRYTADQGLFPVKGGVY